MVVELATVEASAAGSVVEASLAVGAAAEASAAGARTDAELAPGAEQPAGR